MAEPSQAYPNKWSVLAVVAVGVFMATLDSSIVNISLPAIGEHFHVPLGPGVEWVVMSYLVVVASVLLTIGHLADLYGHRAIWGGGLVVFTLGSVLCGASTSLGALIAFRGLQGIGGAMLMAISPALLTSAFPPQERGRAIGMNAVFVSLGITAGPTIGGLITQHLSWRWIFYVNVPIGVVGLVATMIVLPKATTRARPSFDLAGASLLAFGLAAVTAGLSLGPTVGWQKPVPMALIGAGIALLIAFVFVERRHPKPVVDLGLFRDRVFASATLSLVISFIALFAVGVFLPFYLEQLRGMNAQRAGLLLTPLPLTVAVLAPIAGSMADRIGTRGLAATGLTIAAIGLLLVGRLDRDTSTLGIVATLAVTGVGQALFQAPNNSALMGAAPKERRGVAAGMLATSRVVGQSLGVAVASAVFGTLGGAAAGHALASGSPDPAQQHVFEHAFAITFRVCAVIALVGVGASLVRGRERPSQAEARVA